MKIKKAGKEMNKILLSIIIISSLLFYAGCGKQKENEKNNGKPPISIKDNSAQLLKKTKIDDNKEFVKYFV